MPSSERFHRVTREDSNSDKGNRATEVNAHPNLGKGASGGGGRSALWAGSFRGTEGSRQQGGAQDSSQDRESHMHKQTDGENT